MKLSIEEIKNVLIGTLSSFEKDSEDFSELAYHSVLGRNEMMIRDKFAYYLQKSMKNLIVSKETNRIDLLWFPNEEIKKDLSNISSLIEFKAWYSVDLYREDPLKDIVNGTKKDFEKNSSRNCQKTSIITMIHYGDLIDWKYSPIIKYFSNEKGFKKHFSKCIEDFKTKYNEDHKAFYDHLSSKLKRLFEKEDSKKYLIHEVDPLYVGKSHDVRVYIFSWIIE